MKIFYFKAYDNLGKLRKGRLFFETKEECLAYLLRSNLTPIEIKELTQSFFFNLYFKFFFRISLNQKIFLARNLHLILKSGLDLSHGLKILLRETEGALADFLYYLNYNLQRGEPFYKTFTAFPSVFSEVEIETIKSGEISGNLANNLLRWVENLEKKREIRSEIIGNLIYPVIIILMSLVVIFLLLTFVFPRIGILIRELSDNPPLLTKVLLIVSDFVNSNLNLIFVFLFSVILFILIFLSTRRTRKYLTLILMKFPLFSKIYLYFGLSDVLFILHSLLKSGISLPLAIRLTHKTTFHPYLRQALINIENKIVSGRKLGEALLEEKVIPPLLSNILGIASETGNLEETLATMEKYYSQEVKNLINNLLTLLQPTLLIFVGFIVGFVAISVLVPIYQQISTQLQSPVGPGGF